MNKCAKYDPRAFLQASASALCVALLVATFILGVSAGSGWIVLAGVLTYAAAALARSYEPTFRTRLRRREAESAARLPKPETLHDEAVRKAVSSVRRARAELADALRDAPEWLAAQATRTASAADALERLAAGLARHAHYIHGHLERSGLQSARQEVAALDAARERASDPAVARQLELAGTLRRRQVAALEELARARDEDLAALTRVASSLDAARARALCLRTTRGGGGTRLSELHEGIDEMDGELRISEHTALLLEDAGAA